MTDFGRFRLVYESVDPHDAGIEFTLGGEANLEELVKLCKDFLLSNGYQLSDLQVVN